MKLMKAALLMGCAVLVLGCSSDKSAAGTEKGGAATGAATGAVNLHDAGEVGDPVKGAEVFVRVCQACHQADGTGMGGMLAGNFVKDKERLQKPDSVLLNAIEKGITPKSGPIMPPQATTTTAQERKDALAYIRKQFGAK